ncbi:hypothetical protein ACHAQH_009460 [Verticillium albo-atrum]
MEQSILGLQDAGVQATAKHFILNEQEISRTKVRSNDTLVNEALSSNVDDRTVHELYLWPFANAVRAGCASMMCSYQRINGSYACQNSKVLNGLLKDELGFQGYVMSDWWATHSGVASIESGLDMDMPGYEEDKILLSDSAYSSFFGGNVTSAVRNGTVPEEHLNDMIARIMTPYYFLHQDQDFPSVDPSTPYFNTLSSTSDWVREWNLTGEMSRDVRAGHAALIRKQAAASTILLKNERNALPLNSPKTIAVLGNDASPVTLGPLYQLNFEDGTLAIGGGSGTVRFSRRITPLEAIKARAAQDDALVLDWLSNSWLANVPFGTTSWIHPTPPEACIVFTKSWASENVDREFLDLDWNTTAVIENVARDCNNTIVVTHSAGVNVLPFADHPNVTAILLAHYPGQETGNSIVDILDGDMNPSGRLPYTIAYNATDYNAPITTDVETTGLDDWQSWFDEKLEIDYRYFDAHNIPVRYEFGFGLSYSTFEMSNIEARKTSQGPITAVPRNQTTVPGGNPSLWDTLFTVEVTVQNTGEVRGATVAQLYVTYPDSAPEGTPPLQLRGFDKIDLTPGEEGVATFELMRRDLSYWDVVSQQWMIPQGDFKLSVGSSSRDLVETTSITPLSGCTTR